MPTTKHGTVNFINEPMKAATQAAADLRTLEGDLSTRGAGAIIGGVALGLGLLTSVIELAVILSAGKDKQPDSLEVELHNLTRSPLVPYNYIPSCCDIGKVAEPIPSGKSDTFIVARSEGFDLHTSLQIDFLLDNVPVTLKYAYSDAGDPGRWRLTAIVDGQSHEFDSQLQLLGLTFKGQSGYPSFSLYTSPIESKSGKLSVNVYPFSG